MMTTINPNKIHHNKLDKEMDRVHLIRQKDRIVLMSAAEMLHVKMTPHQQPQQFQQQEADDQSLRLKETS